MKLAVAGVNHRTAPVEIRERLAVGSAVLPRELERLRAQPGLREGLILSTCNRVELAVSLDDDADAERCLRDFLSAGEELRPHLFVHEGREAVRHLFRVAASLDSMIVGEPQILGQLKQAYQTAKDAGAVSGLLDNVLTSAFGVAKRVRNETEIGENAVSVSYAAVELAREIFGSLAGSKVLLIGAGKMSELAARHLHASGASQVYVTNRTYERAVEVAKLFKGWIVDYESFKQTLPHADIVIASSGAPDYLLTAEDVRRAVQARRNKPMFLIDIAVPRNIDPRVNELEHAFLYDIDDLQAVVERNLAGRRGAADQAERIVEEEVARFEERLKARSAGPAIVGLQTAFERIRAGEVERLRSKLGPLTPEQEEAVEALTRGIVNKIAHGPISELRRQAASPETMPVLDAIKRIFKL
ncbi:MAG: glutamyl-tRNA reductase [Bryobacteraceae bacterium]|nr:glutamyl-tRNA reductase [Bryobacteraceae bacterium]